MGTVTLVLTTKKKNTHTKQLNQFSTTSDRGTVTLAPTTKKKNTKQLNQFSTTKKTIHTKEERRGLNASREPIRLNVEYSA